MDPLKNTVKRSSRRKGRGEGDGLTYAIIFVEDRKIARIRPSPFPPRPSLRLVAEFRAKTWNAVSWGRDERF